MRVGSSPTRPTSFSNKSLESFWFQGFFVYLQCYKFINMSKIGVKSTGIVTPFIREGDDIVKIVVDCVLEATAKDYSQMDFGGAGHELGYHLNYKNQDVIGITESVVARSAGLYVTVDEIADNIRSLVGDDKKIIVVNPIYSRNRFSMILKAIARAAKDTVAIYMPEYDEVGNPRGVNPFTGVDIKEYYANLVRNEGKRCYIREDDRSNYDNENNAVEIYCGLHDYAQWKRQFLDDRHFTLADICSDKNPDFGLLGCNKATEERIKLFPTVKLAEDVCYAVRDEIKKKTGKEVNVLVYGDGCFHSPAINNVFGSSIWEFADPVTVPGCTHGILDGSPNEGKLKAIIDSSASDAEVRKLVGMNKDRDLVGKMASMGTTPRRYTDLLASLMDLTSGSGDRATPVVLVQNYFKQSK